MRIGVKLALHKSLVIIVLLCIVVISINIVVSLPIIDNVDVYNSRSRQFISSVGLDNRTVWFCPVTDHDGHWLCGNYTVAENVSMLPSVHWFNRTNVLINAYWDGTYYVSEDDGKTYKTLKGVYGDTSDWALDSYVYATLENGVVTKLESG